MKIRWVYDITVEQFFNGQPLRRKGFIGGSEEIVKKITTDYSKPSSFIVEFDKGMIASVDSGSFVVCKSCENICPQCGASDNDVVWDDEVRDYTEDTIEYNGECLKCGCAFTETHKVQYAETYYAIFKGQSASE